MPPGHCCRIHGRRRIRPAGGGAFAAASHRRRAHLFKRACPVSADAAEQILLSTLDAAADCPNRPEVQSGRRSRSWRIQRRRHWPVVEASPEHAEIDQHPPDPARYPASCSASSPAARSGQKRSATSITATPWSPATGPIRDFLILRYTATRRTGPFWDHVPDDGAARLL